MGSVATVASFRTWRDLQPAIAQDPAINSARKGLKSGINTFGRVRIPSSATADTGGERGIRTLGTFYCTYDFQSYPFGRSGISPNPCKTCFPLIYRLLTLPVSRSIKWYDVALSGSKTHPFYAHSTQKAPSELYRVHAGPEVKRGDPRVDLGHLYRAVPEDLLDHPDRHAV